MKDEFLRTLKVRRVAAGLSQSTVDVHCSFKTPKYAMIERGHRKPTKRDLMSIAKVLKIDMKFDEMPQEQFQSVEGDTNE